MCDGNLLHAVVQYEGNDAGTLDLVGLVVCYVNEA